MMLKRFSSSGRLAGVARYFWQVGMSRALAPLALRPALSSGLPLSKGRIVVSSR